jgi:hypothetical protein
LAVKRWPGMAPPVGDVPSPGNAVVEVRNRR